MSLIHFSHCTRVQQPLFKNVTLVWPSLEYHIQVLWYLALKMHLSLVLKYSLA